MNLTLNIYDDKGKTIVKTYESSTYDLMFGTINALMKLLKIEELDNQLELLKIIANAWDEITNVLNGVFEGVTPDDWNHVKVKELVPVIVKIAKFTISEAMTIPNDPKN